MVSTARQKTALLKKIFYSPKGYTGQTLLYRKAKVSDGTVTLDFVRNFLRRQRITSTYKPQRKNFPRLKTRCLFLDQLHEADIIDMQKHRRNNDDYRYILVVVDCLSRFAFAQPLKRKAQSTSSRLLRKSM